MGLDVRVRDSGKHKGKRKLTKMGDPEYRRLLHCVAIAAVRSVFYKAHYEQLQARGLAKTEGLVIVARKLARLAFALLNNQTSFDPLRDIESLHRSSQIELLRHPPEARPANLGTRTASA